MSTIPIPPTFEKLKLIDETIDFVKSKELTAEDFEWLDWAEQRRHQLDNEIRSLQKHARSPK